MTAPIDGGISSKAPMSVEDARSLLITHKEAHKAAMAEAIRRNPNGKLARKFGVKMLDYAILEDRIAEWGGDEGAIFFVVAHVAEGVSLQTLCQHYCLDFGLLWAWLTADQERYERYDMALRGLADGYVGEVVDIADDGLNDTYVDEKGNTRVDTDIIQRSKLRVDARLKVAERYDRKRFGEAKSGLTVNLGANSLLAVLSGMPSAAATEPALVRAPGDGESKRANDTRDVSDAEVIEVDSHAPPVVVTRGKDA